jgi:hypothetical protein
MLWLGAFPFKYFWVTNSHPTAGVCVCACINPPACVCPVRPFSPELFSSLFWRFLCCCACAELLRDKAPFSVISLEPCITAMLVDQ